MATEGMGFKWTFKADSDMSTRQFYFVKLTGGSAVEICSATSGCIGILQNAPSAGQGAEVMLWGVSNISSDGALTLGNFIGPSSDGQGASYTTGTDAGKHYQGKCIKGTTAAAGIATVVLSPVATIIAS